jgi:FkbM family methyltransferase
MTFISYAQNAEDVILWRCFKDIEDGFYIDVGACDPVEYSVTKAFYDRGWSGANIEPVHECYRRFVEQRPRDINLHAALGDGSGVGSIYVIPGTGLSTLDPVVAHAHEKAGRAAHVETVPLLTLKDVCAHIGPRAIHFLKVDVEGGELAVLKGADLLNCRPWVVVVEATTPMSQTRSDHEWRSLLQTCRYEPVLFDGLNLFWIAKEKSDLAQHFSASANVFDRFVTAENLERREQLELATAERDRLSEELEQSGKSLRDEVDSLRASQSGELTKVQIQLDRLRSELHSAIQEIHGRIDDVEDRETASTGIALLQSLAPTLQKLRSGILHLAGAHGTHLVAPTQSSVHAPSAERGTFPAMSLAPSSSPQLPIQATLSGHVEKAISRLSKVLTRTTYPLRATKRAILRALRDQRSKSQASAPNVAEGIRRLSKILTRATYPLRAAKRAIRRTLQSGQVPDVPHVMLHAPPHGTRPLGPTAEQVRTRPNAIEAEYLLLITAEINAIRQTGPH